MSTKAERTYAANVLRAVAPKCTQVYASAKDLRDWADRIEAGTAIPDFVYPTSVPSCTGPWALARRQRDARGPIKERLWWKYDGPFEDGHFDPRKGCRHVFTSRHDVELARHDYGGVIVRIKQ